MKPRIQHPCPIKIDPKNIVNGCFDCKICDEKVIDMTTFSSQEIINYKSENKGEKTCIIVFEDQLDSRFDYTIPLKSKLKYYAAAVVCFFGFSYTPIFAQSVEKEKVEQVVIKKDKKKNNVCYLEDKSEERRRRKLKRKIRFFKRRKHSVGKF